MVICAGIAILCLGALIIRHLRCGNKCDPCPPGPDTLMITLEYWAGSSSSSLLTDQGDQFNAATIIKSIHTDILMKDYVSHHSYMIWHVQRIGQSVIAHYADTD